jgi:hypothetical protein
MEDALVGDQYSPFPTGVREYRSSQKQGGLRPWQSSEACQPELAEYSTRDREHTVIGKDHVQISKTETMLLCKTVLYTAIVTPLGVGLDIGNVHCIQLYM